MPEYRVTRLNYLFVSDVVLDRFDRPAPQRGTVGDWDYVLSDGTLQLFPQIEFRDRATARRDVESLLRAWEQVASLATPPHEIHFEYFGSDIEEVDPQPGILNVFAEEAVGFGVPADAAIARDNAEYPAPDVAFKASDLGDRLLTRYQKVRAGTAELPAVGYFIVDAIEHEFGGRKDMRETASRALNVDTKVLRTLAALTSQADPDIGRHAGTPKPLTAAERAWMEAAIKRLIRRVGEHAAGGTLARLEMSDLPRLA